MFNFQDDMTVTKFILLSILQSQFDQQEGIVYSKPAPEANPNAGPFEDNGLPLDERFQTVREEIQAKINYLSILKS
jgi:hypothetical protein